MVTSNDLQAAIGQLQLTGKPLCLHASLRSFGWVEGDAATIVDAFQAEQCTLLVPTFSWAYAVAPPAHLQFRRNGADYEYLSQLKPSGDSIFTPTKSPEIDPEMGAIAAAVLHQPESRRGKHPLCSFAALGPLAETLISPQKPEDVFAPLETLAHKEGFVVLAGVNLTKMTLIHLAEKKAGLVQFRRWANDPTGQPAAVETGGCSDGFLKLESLLSPLLRKARVGNSDWQVYPASEALAVSIQAIKNNHNLTHCGNAACERCNDLTAGGPILE